MAAGISAYIGIVETVVVGTAICFGIAYVAKRTSDPLWRHSTVTLYWREELGGNPDADDEYDLMIPLQSFQARARANRKWCELAGAAVDKFTSRNSEVWLRSPREKDGSEPRQKVSFSDVRSAGRSFKKKITSAF